MKKQIRAVLKKVSLEIAANSHGGKYSAGLASEGYTGGYRDALNDVLLLMNRVKPSRRNWWEP
jgi:hypothetical protein